MSATATQASTPVASDCSVLLKNTPELKIDDFVLRLPATFNKPFKVDNFESDAAYKSRIAKAQADHAEKAEKFMSTRGRYFRLTDPEAAAQYHYDANRQVFKLNMRVLYPDSRKDGSQLKLPTISISDGRPTRTTSMGLGAKKEISGHMGFAFKTKLTSPELKRGYAPTNIAVPAALARDLAPHIGFAYVGYANAPWAYRTYTVTEDFDNLVSSDLVVNYVAVDLLCAAVVDTRTHEVIRLFK